MNIGRMLTDSAERHPDRPAFIHGDEVTTYRHANARANALAAGLRHLGMKRGDRVAVWMWNRPELLEGFFGVWKAGGCVVGSYKPTVSWGRLGLGVLVGPGVRVGVKV